MKQKIILFVALLISAFAFSQATIEIVLEEGDLSFKHAGAWNVDLEKTYRAHEVTFEFASGKFQFFEDQKKIEEKYAWTDFIQPAGEDFSTIDKVKSYFKKITNFKTGSGTEGQSTAQIGDQISDSLNVKSKIISAATYALKASDNNKTLITTNVLGCKISTLAAPPNGYNVTILQASLIAAKLNFSTLKGSAAILAQTKADGEGMFLFYDGSNYRVMGGVAYEACIADANEHYTITSALADKNCTESNDIPVIGLNGFTVEVVAGDGGALEGDWVLEFTATGTSGNIDYTLPNVTISDDYNLYYSASVSDALMVSSTTSWYSMTGEENNVITTTMSQYAHTVTITGIARFRIVFATMVVGQKLRLGFVNYIKTN